MSTLFEMRTEPMPSEMQVLLSAYPRDSWEAHPGFRDKTRQWMGAHRMFRRLGATVRTDAEQFIDGNDDAEHFISRLAYYGDALVRNLHGHHHFEDHFFFPELEAADARFSHGLEILEKDHEELDQVLDAFTRRGNAIIKLHYLGQRDLRDAVGEVPDAASAIEAFLDRHLSDEEELAVPIILHHRLRG